MAAVTAVGGPAAAEARGAAWPGGSSGGWAGAGQRR